jgi:hypothetical protein
MSLMGNSLKYKFEKVTITKMIICRPTIYTSVRWLPYLGVIPRDILESKYKKFLKELDNYGHTLLIYTQNPSMKFKNINKEKLTCDVEYTIEVPSIVIQKFIG